MKTVGFIDYYLDEWHANKYPAWIKEQSGGEFEVKYAYAAIEPKDAGKISNREWAESKGITLVDTIGELLEKSDCIVILAPDDPQMHYELAKDALATGKPVFIDKTFAENGSDAERIFAAAKSSGSPCYSSSALRFSPKLQAIETKDITTVISVGGGKPKDYLVHQLEPLAVLMGTDVEQVQFIGNGVVLAWVLKFRDGRTAELHLLTGRCGYTLHIDHNGTNEILTIDDGFWFHCMEAMLEFFRSGKPAVEHQVTVDIMHLIDCCIQAMDYSGEWRVV